MITIKCPMSGIVPSCKGEFQVYPCELKAAEKLGKKLHCSQVCSGKCPERIAKHKESLGKRSKVIDLECYGCGITFQLKESVYNKRVRNNCKHFYHSKECKINNFHKFTYRKKEIIHQESVNKFWENVIKGNNDNDCWTWAGKRGATGYGYTRVSGKECRAHRFSYILHHGEIADDLIVRHKCHKRDCCNPLHLELGTNQDNSNDTKKANRQSKGSVRHNTKMNEETAAKIKYMYHKLGMRQCEILAAFKDQGISKTMVQSTCAGNWWKHVPIPD